MPAIYTRKKCGERWKTHRYYFHQKIKKKNKIKNLNDFLFDCPTSCHCAYKFLISHSSFAIQKKKNELNQMQNRLQKLKNYEVKKNKRMLEVIFWKMII